MGQVYVGCPFSPQYPQSPSVLRRDLSVSVKCQNPPASSSIGVVPSADCEGALRLLEGGTNVLGMVAGDRVGAGCAEGVDQVKGSAVGLAGGGLVVLAPGRSRRRSKRRASRRIARFLSSRYVLGLPTGAISSLSSSFKLR